MGQWYCTVNGRQYGPISEEHLRDWIAEHRVGPSDMVWTEGMAAWTPASFVPGLFGPGPVRAPRPGPAAPGGQDPGARPGRHRRADRRVRVDQPGLGGHGGAVGHRHRVLDAALAD